MKTLTPFTQTFKIDLTKPVGVHKKGWRSWLFDNNYQPYPFFGQWITHPFEWHIHQGIIAQADRVWFRPWRFQTGGFFAGVKSKGYAIPPVGKEHINAFIVTTRGWQFYRKIIESHWVYPKAPFSDFEDCILGHIKSYNRNAARRRAKGINIVDI